MLVALCRLCLCMYVYLRVWVSGCLYTVCIVYVGNLCLHLRLCCFLRLYFPPCSKVDCSLIRPFPPFLFWDGAHRHDPPGPFTFCPQRLFRAPHCREIASFRGMCYFTNSDDTRYMGHSKCLPVPAGIILSFSCCFFCLSKFESGR